MELEQVDEGQELSSSAQERPDARTAEGYPSSPAPPDASSQKPYQVEKGGPSGESIGMEVIDATAN
jgi:hypothetical protein